jgi:hypothetical protein
MHQSQNRKFFLKERTTQHQFGHANLHTRLYNGVQNAKCFLTMGIKFSPVDAIENILSVLNIVEC